MTRSIWSSLILACLLAACGGGSNDNTVEERILAVEAGLLPPVVEAGEPAPAMALLERMEFYGVPGVSVTVINDGKIEWSRAYGVVENGGSKRVDNDTLFQVASVSKTIAAASIMFLAQNEFVDIEQEANNYLSSWTIPDNEFTSEEKVTVRELLSHTGGLNVDSFDGYSREGSVPSLLQILNGLHPANNVPVRVVSIPGTQFSYSGGGMETLRQLLEDVTGQSYRDYVRQALFSPLGMETSDYLQPTESEAASGHDWYGNVVAGKWNNYPEFAAAGLWATSADLARFLLAVQKASMGEEGGVFSSATIAAMLTPQATVTGETKQGLGFQLRGELFLHNGANNGYRARVVAYRDRPQGVVILTNGDNGTYVIDELCRSIAKVYGWPDYQPEERQLVSVPAETLASYVGRYERDGNSSVYNVTANESGLFIQIEGQSNISFPLYAISSDTFLFRVSDSAGEIKFVTGGFEYRTETGAIEMTASRVSD